MLGRWRSQQSAKHLEEERLNAERERSSNGDANAATAATAASPRSPGGAAPPTPDTAPPSNATSPRSTEASFHSMHTPEPPSTPASPAGDQPTPVHLDPPTADDSLYDPYSTPRAWPHPTPTLATVPDSDLEDTPRATEGGAASHSPSPGGSIRDTPTSPMIVAQDLNGKPYEDIPVAENEVTSSEDLQPKAADDVPISNGSDDSQNDSKLKISSPEDSIKKATSEIVSDNLERSKPVEDSAVAKDEENFGKAFKNINEKASDEVEAVRGLDARSKQKQTIQIDSKSSRHSKNSDGQQSLEADSNESSPNSPQSEGQTCKFVKPDTLHCEFGLGMPRKYDQHPRRPLNGARSVQIVETSRRPESPFETVNYLSQSTLVQCAQRTLGAAKANRVTGCAVSLVEKGVSLVTAPVIPLIRWWQTPLLCVDRVVYRGFSEVARAFSCVPQAEEVCCGFRGCRCGIPITYMGEETEIDEKEKQE